MGYATGEVLTDYKAAIHLLTILCVDAQITILPI